MTAAQEPDTVLAFLARPLGRFVIAGVIAAFVLQVPPSWVWAIPVCFIVVDWLLMRRWGTDSSVGRQLALRFGALLGATALVVLSAVLYIFLFAPPLDYSHCTASHPCTLNATIGEKP